MSEIKDILRDAGFCFNKSFGQNFITDTNLLQAIVADAQITADDVVVEVGTGAGTLTRELAKVCKKVVSFEIDEKLMPVLNQTLKGYDDKIQVVFKDITKVTTEEIKQLTGGTYKVVANLPYYITTPIIMFFLESEFKPQSLTVMVQKEVAQRLVAKANTSDYGVITLSVQIEGEAVITRIVPNTMFMPMPKVDSAVVRIDILPKQLSAPKSTLKKFIKCAFAMRRKTLSNNIANVYPYSKQQILQALTDVGLNEKIRGEALTLEKFLQLITALNQA